MAFWDFLKEDNSIKTTQEHFEYFDNIRKENLQDIENQRIEFLTEAKIPEEFKQYIEWVDEEVFYLVIPFLKSPIVVRDYGDEIHFYDGFSIWDNHRESSFKNIMKYAIGTNEIKVK